MSSSLEKILKHDRALVFWGSFLLIAVFTGGFFLLNTDELVRTDLDPDFYRILGRNLAETGMLSFDPQDGPSLSRGPVYPAIIAFCEITGGDVYLLFFIQSILAAMSAFLLYLAVRMSIGIRAGLFSVAFLLIHPLFIRYPGTVLVETTATFFLTCLLYLSIRMYEKPTAATAIAIGLSLGLGALTKSTFLVLLPIVLIVPILAPKRSLKSSLIALLACMIVVLPWTYRNYRISERVIPVHLLAGYNMYRGDLYVQHFSDAPFSYLGLWLETEPKSDSLMATVPRGLRSWEEDLYVDSLYFAASSDIYEENRAFILRKVGLNAVMFWTTMQTKTKSMVVSMFRLPIFLLGLYCLIVLFRERKWSMLLPFLLLSVYYAAHLPLFAVGRFSAVLTPVEAFYAGIGLLLFIHRRKFKEFLNPPV